MSKKGRRKLVRPTAAEDKAINEGISCDPDTSEATAEDFAKARGRGPQKGPKKVAVSIRLDQRIVDAYKAGGTGWQSRINDTLLDTLKAEDKDKLKTATGKGRTRKEKSA
ncbi:BrnA antitoxin family protein [Parahaliea maris]|uniref:BrnA antitoxin family protein n=1 Tax=Parahaliea maris TaxID=2716870 RepID=A0A5C9A5M6_9GAMM|nr:BrnA antitoxin family protein [Parahaliea maris]TXS96215.1 BrnA antitoxin family protein [Parahaliea maris]